MVKKCSFSFALLTAALCLPSISFASSVTVKNTCHERAADVYFRSAHCYLTPDSRSCVLTVDSNNPEFKVSIPNQQKKPTADVFYCYTDYGDKGTLTLQDHGDICQCQNRVPA